MNICEFLDRFNNEEACLRYLMSSKFGQPNRCPDCGHVGSFRRLKPKRYTCARCHESFRPTAHTFLHNTPLPAQLWFYALLLFSTARHGLSAGYLERHLGITPAAAWRMGHRIRGHLTALNVLDAKPFTEPGSVVCIDETLVTGLLSNDRKGARRAIVFGITDGSRVIAMRVADRSKRTILPLIEHYVSKEVLVVTDGFQTYSTLHKLGYAHQVVIHSKGIWKNGEGFTSAPIEVFWSAFKRFIRQTHYRIMDKYLELYLGEFLFRYNHRGAPAIAIEDAFGAFPDILKYVPVPPCRSGGAIYKFDLHDPNEINAQAGCRPQDTRSTSHASIAAISPDEVATEAHASPYRRPQSL